MNNYSLFEKVQHILAISKEKEKQATIRGENYNIFEIMGLSTNEVKLHSSLLADLLNPKGLHGLGIKPLKLFLKIFDLKFSEEELAGAIVDKEHHIAPISKDGNQGGNIDILIKIKDYYILIENKINAADQDRQLYRYKNYIKNDPHTLFYLTLNGHETSEMSANGLIRDIDYICISYDKEILKWLEDVLVLSIKLPLIRETLQQYIKTIQKLTFMEMKEIDESELFKTMDMYPDVVREILHNQWEYRLHLVKEYILKPLENYFSQLGFLWFIDQNFDNQAKYSAFGIYRPEWEKKIVIGFKKQDFSDGYFAVYDSKERAASTNLLLGKESSLSCPYGYTELADYKSWNISIAQEIISGKVYNYVKEIFEKLYKRIEQRLDLYPMT